MDFLDRKDERKKFKTLIKDIDSEAKLLVIKGIPGSGKTAFLRQVLQEYNINCFKTYTNNNILKCLQNETKKSYSMIISCIYAIKKSNPKFFADFSMSFYNRLCNTTNTEAAAIVFSKLNLLGVQDVVKHSISQVQNSLQSINDYLAEIQMRDYFSELLVKYILKLYSNIGYIAFCIDDIQWIDEQSKNILIDVIHRINNENLCVSLFVTQRNDDSITQNEAEQIIDFYRELTECINRMSVIEIKNFDVHTTHEYLKSKSSILLDEYRHEIYNITKGNPQDLFIAVMNPDKFNPNKIKKLEDGQDYLKNNSIMTVEVIMSIINSDTICSCILKILAIIESEVSDANLYAISQIILENSFLRGIFNDAIRKLLSQCVIIRTEKNNYKIAHDIIREKVLGILESNGEYREYAIKISSYYYESCKNLHTCNHELFTLIKILSYTDGLLGYKYFCEQFTQRDLDIDICVVASECFISDINNFTDENLNSNIIVKLLNKLVSSAEIKAAKTLCECLLKHQKHISNENLIIIFIQYIKVQIDTSNIDNGVNSAIELLNKLLGIQITDPNTKFETYLLAMSTYEHIMGNSQIHYYYKRALELLSDNISIELKTIFYRNLGLVKPHQELLNEYNIAVQYSKEMSKSCYSCLIHGTCLNNLGLAYLYSENPEKALNFFMESLEIIKSCGYDESRLHNNIGVGYCLIGDYYMARSSFEMAAKLQKNDPFMMRCISANLALALYKTNNKKEAVELVDKIISEYYQDENRVSDTVAYCSALINKGFFCFLKGNFEEGEKYYTESLFHKYRASNDKFTQKRYEMINLCKTRGNIQESKKSVIDLSDCGNNIFNKPYSVVPFAFYVI